MQDVFSYWRKTGIGTHRILAFAEVSRKVTGSVFAALYDFGAVHVGMQVTRAAMDQFNMGRDWTVAAGHVDQSPVLGGHAVVVVEADLKGVLVVSWGRLQRMSWAFWDAFVDEAWVTISAEWVRERDQVTPSGLDWSAFGAEFTRLTGQPFVPPVPPAPTPAPGTPDAADVRLAAVLRPWAGRHHVGSNIHAAEAARAWMRAKGL
jgi:hypothetical protein